MIDNFELRFGIAFILAIVVLFLAGVLVNSSKNIVTDSICYSVLTDGKNTNLKIRLNKQGKYELC